MRAIPVLMITTLLLLAYGCSKDKFTTIPQLSISSISPDSVFSGDIMRIKGKYTDKEGDIDSIFVVRKYFAGETPTLIDTIERFQFARLGVPDNTTKADMEVAYEYNTDNYPDIPLLNGVSKDTSAAFGIILKDKAGNRSVYSESKKVRLKKP